MTQRDGEEGRRTCGCGTAADFSGSGTSSGRWRGGSGRPGLGWLRRVQAEQPRKHRPPVLLASSAPPQRDLARAQAPAHPGITFRSPRPPTLTSGAGELAGARGPGSQPEGVQSCPELLSSTGSTGGRWTARPALGFVEREGVAIKECPVRTVEGLGLAFCAGFRQALHQLELQPQSFYARL